MSSKIEMKLRFPRIWGAACLLIKALPSVASNLLRCWGILLVPIIFVAIAIGTDQGRDALAVAVSSAEFLGKGYHAYAAQAVTTVLATLTAIVVLSRRAPGHDARRYADYHVPGFVGLLAGLLPVVMLQETNALSGEAPFDINLFVAIGSLMSAVWIIGARDILPKLRWDTAVVIAMVSLGVINLAVLLVVQGLAGLMLTWAALAIVDLMLWRRSCSGKAQSIVAWFVALFAIAGGGLVAFIPARWGLWIGSYAVLLVALNFWLGVGCLLLILLHSRIRYVVRLLRYLARRMLRLVPKERVRGVFQTTSQIVPTVFVLLIAELFLTGPFDLREVRLLDGPPDPSPASGLQQLAQRWLTARQDQISRSGSCYPIFVVSADGGGVRAAWWSASILATLQDREPEFAEHVFAISGVSGGSLGAAVFAARAAYPPAPESACASLPWRGCTDAVLARDFLGPAIGEMVIGDAWRAITRIDRLPDRATALEEAFEQAWAGAIGRNSFGEAFTQLWADDRAMRVPSLLLNATEARTVRRLVLGPVPLFDSSAERADLGALVDRRSLRLSTAVSLSARFPGVSPAGWLPNASADHSELGTAIVDGGFADNSGATTAAETIAALRAAAAELKLSKVMPVALMIANDPVSPDSQTAVAGPGSRSAFATTTFGSLVAPVMNLNHLRQLTTARAKQEYIARVSASGGMVLDGFDLRADGKKYPLGWMLAARTREDMGRQIDAMAADPVSHMSIAAGLLSRWCGNDASAP